jgi:hypothetical protein
MKEAVIEMNKILCCVVLVASCLVPGAFAQGQERLEDRVLTASNPQVQDFTGRHVEVSGEWVFVASWNAGLQGLVSVGKVTVFRRTETGVEWFQELTSDILVQSEGFSEFGIDADGDVLVVAGYRYPSTLTRTGKATVFRFNGTSWALEATLEPRVALGPPYLDFATQVRVVGDSIFVSAPGLGPPLVGGGQSWRGGFYEYQYQNGIWIEVQVWVFPVDLATAGWSLATDGETIVLGGPGPFLAFILERNSGTGLWEMTQIIRDAVRGVNDDDGLEFAIEGDLIAMGADEHNGANLGKVVLYRRIAGTWIQGQTIFSNDPHSSGTRFGKSVDLRNGRLLIGDTTARPPGGTFLSGSAYLYEQDAQGHWVEVYRFRKSTGNNSFSRMGVSVALGDDFAIVGDRDHSLTAAAQVEGAAFVFDLPLGEDVCNGLANSTGASAWLEALGSRQIDKGLLRLRAGDLVPGQMAMFIAGESSGYVINPGGSQGALCLGGRLARFNRPGELGVASADGRMERVIGTDSIPVNPTVPILAGESWVFQCWYRDNNAGFSSNFSAAVEVQFE